MPGIVIAGSSRAAGLRCETMSSSCAAGIRSPFRIDEKSGATVRFTTQAERAARKAAVSGRRHADIMGHGCDKDRQLRIWAERKNRKRLRDKPRHQAGPAQATGRRDPDAWVAPEDPPTAPTLPVCGRHRAPLGRRDERRRTDRGICLTNAALECCRAVRGDG